MGTQPWRLFRSSNSAVIADENLLVTPHATDDKTVTITANLKSARFGGYYETCKDNSSYADVLDTLKKLAGEEVSVTVTVVSTANQAARKPPGRRSTRSSRSPRTARMPSTRLRAPTRA